MKSATQGEQVRLHLLSGAALTPAEARKQWGCDRLAARIGELRDEGLDIIDIRSQCKARYSVYRLMPKAGTGELFARVQRGRPE